MAHLGAKVLEMCAAVGSSASCSSGSSGVCGKRKMEEGASRSAKRLEVDVVDGMRVKTYMGEEWMDRYSLHSLRRMSIEDLLRVFWLDTKYKKVLKGPVRAGFMYALRTKNLELVEAMLLALGRGLHKDMERLYPMGRSEEKERVKWLDRLLVPMCKLCVSDEDPQFREGRLLCMEIQVHSSGSNFWYNQEVQSRDALRIVRKYPNVCIYDIETSNSLSFLHGLARAGHNEDLVTDTEFYHFMCEFMKNQDMKAFMEVWEKYTNGEQDTQKYFPALYKYAHRVCTLEDLNALGSIHKVDLTPSEAMKEVLKGGNYHLFESHVLPLLVPMTFEDEMRHKISPTNYRPFLEAWLKARGTYPISGLQHVIMNRDCDFLEKFFESSSLRSGYLSCYIKQQLQTYFWSTERVRWMAGLRIFLRKGFYFVGGFQFPLSSLYNAKTVAFISSSPHNTQYKSDQYPVIQYYYNTIPYHLPHLDAYLEVAKKDIMAGRPFRVNWKSCDVEHLRVLSKHLTKEKVQELLQKNDEASLFLCKGLEAWKVAINNIAHECIRKVIRSFITALFVEDRVGLGRLSHYLHPVEWAYIQALDAGNGSRAGNLLPLIAHYRPHLRPVLSSFFLEPRTVNIWVLPSEMYSISKLRWPVITNFSEWKLRVTSYGLSISELLFRYPLLPASSSILKRLDPRGHNIFQAPDETRKEKPAPEPEEDKEQKDEKGKEVEA